MQMSISDFCLFLLLNERLGQELLSPSSHVLLINHTSRTGSLWGTQFRSHHGPLFKIVLTRPHFIITPRGWAGKIEKEMEGKREGVEKEEGRGREGDRKQAKGKRIGRNEKEKRG